jgi:hypothetical protein
MLENLDLIDFSIFSLDYKEGEFKPKAGGSIKFEVSRAENMEFSETVTDGMIHFIDTVHIDVDAKNDDDESTSAFRLLGEIQVVYQCPAEMRSKLNKRFFEKNGWFFSNNAHMVSYEAVTKVLNETKYRGASYMLPRHRARGPQQDSE